MVQLIICHFQITVSADVCTHKAVKKCLQTHLQAVLSMWLKQHVSAPFHYFQTTYDFKILHKVMEQEGEATVRCFNKKLQATGCNLQLLSRQSTHCISSLSCCLNLKYCQNQYCFLLWHQLLCYPLVCKLTLLLSHKK